MALLFNIKIIHHIRIFWLPEIDLEFEIQIEEPVQR